jgi:hypothetical protein
VYKAIEFTATTARKKYWLRTWNYDFLTSIIRVIQPKGIIIEVDTFNILDFKIYRFVYTYIYIYIYIQISGTTLLPIVSVWDPRMQYKFWYFGSLLWKAWLWLNRVEACCHKNVLYNKLLCLTEIYTLYGQKGWD